MEEMKIPPFPLLQVPLRASAKWLKCKCFGCNVADPAVALSVRKVTLSISSMLKMEMALLVAIKRVEA